MKKIVSAFALSLLVTLGCEKEEDGPKKTYMYINLYNLGREMDYLKNFSPDVYSYEDVGFLSASVSAIKIKRFWLKDSEGHTVEVDPKKIYTQTPAVPSGFDATTPIELPPYDYSRYGIEVENVTTQTELKASGSVINTAISKNSTTAPAEGSVINLYPTQQFDPITISGKVIGSDGPVYRLTLFVNANVEQTSTTTNGIKTVSQKLSYYLLNNSDLINPKKKPGIEGCIE
jgi:hypothetical protein